MSIQDAASKFTDALVQAHARHDEGDLAQTARIARIEGQWLELQGEWRAALKALLDGQKQILRALGMNGSGGEHG